MIFYVGPGAGFAFFSTIFLLILSGLIALLAFAVVPLKWIRAFLRTVIPVQSLRWIAYVLLAIGLIGGAGWWKADISRNGSIRGSFFWVWTVSIPIFFGR